MVSKKSSKKRVRKAVVAAQKGVARGIIPPANKKKAAGNIHRANILQTKAIKDTQQRGKGKSNVGKHGEILTGNQRKGAVSKKKKK